MTPFDRLESVAAPLLRDNIDTDLIIRVEPLFNGVARDELGPYCFESLRYRPDGTEDPDFVFNRPATRHARILLAGANFGCGSSREGAVWALLALGVRCVIAPASATSSTATASRTACFRCACPAPTWSRWPRKPATAPTSP